MKTLIPVTHQAQRGAAAVEFALIAWVFLMLLIGIMEFGRIFFYWNTATEATRLGARIAVVCDKDDAAITAGMQALFPLLTATDISLDYQPGGCSRDTCEFVTVSIKPGKEIKTFIPFVPLNLTLARFSTTLTRESMDSSGSNPVCQ